MSEVHDIDIMNWALVGFNGETFVFPVPAIVARNFTVDEALVLAAWLVAMADSSPGNTRFEEILQRVCNT